MRFRFPRAVLRRLTLLLLWLVWLAPVAGWSHPLGNFTINRYSRLEVGDARIRLYYVVDMAEIPTFQERARIDRDHDGALSDAETAAWLEETVALLTRQLRLAVDGETLPLQIQTQRLEWPPGQGGLPTLRLSLNFMATPPQGTLRQAEYRDLNFTGRLGWREIVTQAGEDASLLDSSAPDHDVSDALRRYPDDFLQSPLNVERAVFRFAPLAVGGRSAGPAPAPDVAAASGVGRGDASGFTRLITLPELAPATAALALLLAFLWGAGHALTPGHGKTLAAAYLVGSRATVRHAVLLGATTTFTHTASVFALGLLTLGASHWLAPERLYPWLETVSGLLVAGVGAALLRGRLRHWRAARAAHASDHAHHAHDHAPEHDHSHSHSHSHDHNHSHSHDHGHFHPHPHAHAFQRADHRQAPAIDESGPITWRSLLALGVSGGLLPCPAALVVMLGAIALDRVGFGLALIVLFSLGLAGALTTLGVLLVRARSLLERLGQEGRLLGRFPLHHALLQALPAVSALLILLVGVGMTLTALVQTGWLRL